VPLSAWEPTRRRPGLLATTTFRSVRLARTLEAAAGPPVPADDRGRVWSTKPSECLAEKVSLQCSRLIEVPRAASIAARRRGMCPAATRFRSANVARSGAAGRGFHGVCRPTAALLPEHHELRMEISSAMEPRLQAVGQASRSACGTAVEDRRPLRCSSTKRAISSWSDHTPLLAARIGAPSARRRPFHSLLRRRQPAPLRAARPCSIRAATFFGWDRRRMARAGESDRLAGARAAYIPSSD